MWETLCCHMETSDKNSDINAPKGNMLTLWDIVSLLWVQTWSISVTLLHQQYIFMNTHQNSNEIGWRYCSSLEDEF